MALTYLKLKNQAQLYGSVSSKFDVADIVNEAGSYLFDMHAWNCLIAPPTTLSFVASQAYMDLPPDFGKMVSYAMTSGLTSTLSFSTPSQIAQMRSEGVSQSSQAYWVAFSHPTQTQRTEQPSQSRLELWPTPTAASAAVITIWYRRQWTDLVDDTDAPNIPKFLNPLLRRIVSEFAQAYDEADTGSLDARMAVIEAGPVLNRLKEHDGMEYPDLGHIEGGALHGHSTGWDGYDWRATASSSNPA